MTSQTEHEIELGAGIGQQASAAQDLGAHETGPAQDQPDRAGSSAGSGSWQNVGHLPESGEGQPGQAAAGPGAWAPSGPGSSAEPAETSTATGPGESSHPITNDQATTGGSRADGELPVETGVEPERRPGLPSIEIRNSGAPFPGMPWSSESGVGIAIMPPATLANGRLRSLIAPPENSEPEDSPDQGSRARTRKTEREYETRVRSLYKRSVKKRTIDPELPAVVSPMDVVEDYMQEAINQSPASWRLYRAALLWHLATHRDRHQIYEDAYQLLASTRRAPGPNPGSGGSEGKRQRPRPQKKTIPEADLIKLINVLGAMNRTVNWGARVQYWLIAGLSSGARPSEWERAGWLDDRKLVLCLPNAKRKRSAPIWGIVADGKTIHDIERDQPDLIQPGAELDPSTAVRNVPIDFDDAFGRLNIDLHLDSLHSFMAENADKADPFKTYYDRCREVLRLACHRAFKGKKMYSLYVMRSQFAANKKAVNDLRTVADLMGHSSTRVTMGSYGPRRAAHSRGRGVMSERHASSASQSMTESGDYVQAMDNETGQGGRAPITPGQSGG